MLWAALCINQASHVLRAVSDKSNNIFKRSIITETGWLVSPGEGGSVELWYHSSLCFSAEKNSARGKVMGKE